MIIIITSNIQRCLLLGKVCQDLQFTVNKEPFEKCFEKFISSKINTGTLHKGNISRKELFVVFVSRAEYLPQLKTGKRDGMQSNIVP